MNSAGPFVHGREPETGSGRASPLIALAIHRNQQFAAARCAVLALEGSGRIAEQDLVLPIPYEVGLFGAAVAVNVKLFRPRIGAGGGCRCHSLSNAAGLCSARWRRHTSFLLYFGGVNLQTR